MFNIQEKQNYPFLDHIVSSINSNPEMFKLTTLVEANNIPSDSITPSQSIKSSCSKHTESKGEYYETEYPWVKYCQSCALNLALCGKKIQRSMSSQQMLNKIKLCDILQSMGEAIKLTQKYHDQYSLMSNNIQQSRHWLASVVGEVDKFISSLTDIRNCLQENIQVHLNAQIKNMFEKQSLITSKKIELINQKSRIECGFVNLIGNDHEQEAIETIERGRTLMKEVEGMIVSEQYRLGLAEKVMNLQAMFEAKISQIKCMQLIVNLTQAKPPQWSEHQQMPIAQNYRTAKTQKTQQSDSSNEHQPRTSTAYSTIQNSTPCNELNNQASVPLMQQSQNRKNTRGTLQLKARCRSRSGHKKVEVNVRENIVESAVKKKLA